MENRGKDGIMGTEGISHLRAEFLKFIFIVFLEFIEKRKNGKSGSRLDLAPKDLFHLKDEFSEFTPLF